MLSKTNPLKDEATYRSEANGWRSICHTTSNLKNKVDIRAGSFIRDKMDSMSLPKSLFFKKR